MPADSFEMENYARTVAAYYGVSDVRLRPAQRSDFNRLTQIQVSALFAATQADYAGETIRRYVERHLRQTLGLCETPTFFVATISDRVIGSGGWTWAEGAGADIPCAVGFYVDPAHGGRGIGRSLLALTEASAKKNGVAALSAFAPLLGTDMFRRAGYTAGDVIAFDLGDGVHLDHLVLRKRLNL